MIGLSGINSFFSLVTTIVPLFFGTHFTGFTYLLSDIRYTTPVSSHVIIPFFTTFCIGGLSLHSYSDVGGHSFSNYILWVQMPGKILIILAIIKLIALLYFYKKKRSSSTCHSKSATIIMGKVLCSPKNAYQR